MELILRKEIGDSVPDTSVEGNDQLIAYDLEEDNFHMGDMKNAMPQFGKDYISLSELENKAPTFKPFTLSSIKNGNHQTGKESDDHQTGKESDDRQTGKGK